MYRGINVFIIGYQHRNNLVEDTNGDLFADCPNIFNRWKSYFSQLLNIHNDNYFRRMEVHTAEPLIPGHSHLEVEIAITKPKSNPSLGSDQIPVELVEGGGETLVSVIDKLINST
jgi:hypothetical protein